MGALLFIPTAFAAVLVAFGLVSDPGDMHPVIRIATYFAIVWLATMAIYGIGSWAGWVS